MKCAVILLALLPMLSVAGDQSAPADYRTALQVINSDGDLTISDGSSFYTFKKDGSFVSGPCGISGRTMLGSWRAPGGDGGKIVSFLVDAKIGWMNGITPVKDVRTIRIIIYPPFERVNPHLYHCYFLIDEMTKKF